RPRPHCQRAGADPHASKSPQPAIPPREGDPARTRWPPGRSEAGSGRCERGAMSTPIVDAWMQHPSRALMADPMFDSLRRWAHGQLPTQEVSIERTLASMEAAGVSVGLLSAWWGPHGPLIANDDVA